MIEIITEAIGPIGLTLAGFILGRRERNLREPQMYRCECRHSLAHHKKDKSSRCMYGTCSCQQYVGTRPFESDV